MTCSSHVNNMDLSGEKKFSTSSSVGYTSTLSNTGVFCRKKCPPVVILPLVNLKYEFWLNLNLSKDLLISLGILSQNNHPFRLCLC